ncbi:LegC family aminotransferase [Chitinophaga alhagiae]|uniref:LegC family aminotransferase n=1 Tax=Chitinophaga alhagiae TaxID=2203219 RepID=A0ABM6WB52_9BACT|nr:LegC family aminotransferase [Chitinophaga alhagiae]AWO01186.1 LegC family aminotransferase [Chitinophaga alhagiae]
MIPLSVPHLAGNEWKYVKECLDTGWISTAGEFVNRFEQKIAAFSGAKYAVAAMNGTAALHISLQLGGVKAGDYVIAPNITFVASINSISYTGAKPILMDVTPGSWQLDIELLEEFLLTQTLRDDQGKLRYKKDNGIIAAIMPVHVLGNMCDMDRFMHIAGQYGLTVIEDATESLGSYYKARHSGTFGLFGAFSFNGNKIISTGGGGMIVTNDEELARKAKHITTTAKKDPIEYYHDEVGYNYRLVNILAAIGVAQTEQLPEFILRKKYMDNYYREHLRGVGDILFQEVSSDVDPNCWLFTMSTMRQPELLKTLNAQGIQCRPFWVPMSLLPMYKNAPYITHNHTSEKVYGNCLSIPSSVNLTEENLEAITTAIKAFY